MPSHEPTPLDLGRGLCAAAAGLARLAGAVCTTNPEYPEYLAFLVAVFGLVGRAFYPSGRSDQTDTHPGWPAAARRRDDNRPPQQAAAEAGGSPHLGHSERIRAEVRNF